MATTSESVTGDSGSDAAATTATDSEGDTSLAEMKKAFEATVTDGGKKKSIWRMSMDTFGMAEGKSQKSDVMCDDLESSLVAIKKMVETKSKEEKWTFPYTPFEELSATKDDLLTAFCKWASDKEDANGEISGKINISKAFRRLESYVDWMDETAKRTKGECIGVFNEPLTAASVKKSAEAMGMFLTEDKDNRLVWWMDFAKLEVKQIKGKAIPVKDQLRFAVWMTHIAMYHKGAQDKGMVLIEDMDNMGFYAMMTLFPNDMATSFDRLTIGVMPIKMKRIIVAGAGTWMKVLMALMKPFISKKMRGRFCILGKKQNLQEEAEKEIGGKEYILDKCCGLEGEIETDILFGKYFK